MTERHPAHALISEMETDVSDVERWGILIRDLGIGQDEVGREGLYVIGSVLMKLGARLDARWKAAFAATGGQS
jgi:hypothetical protein